MAPRAIIGVLVFALAAFPALAQSHKAPAAAAATKKEPPARTDAKDSKDAKADASGDPVIARVNGTPIFRSDLEVLRSSLPANVQKQPAEQLYPRLVDQLVALQLVSQSARKDKLNDQAHVRKLTMLAEEQILQDAYFDGIMRKEITEAKLKARYDQTIKNAAPHEEVHARHILVATEEEAKQIIAELKKGADFAKLASEKTTDPAGKASGGDLGYFGQGDMVPEFAKAAFALKPGEFSQTPVKTQFGWHVIKVEDRRQGKPPTYEEVAPQLARQMAQELYTEKVKQLASASKIEVFNADGSRPTASAAPPPAGEPAAAAAPPPPQVGGGPELLPFQNGTPGAPPPMGGPPTMAPATQGLGGK
jgi:peptidyl-prolyl cis-trans isomerase C